MQGHYSWVSMPFFGVQYVMFTPETRRAGNFNRPFLRGASWGLQMVGSLKMNTTLEYSTRVVQEGDRRCEKSTLNDLAYLTPLRIPLMNPVSVREI
jgi:hypothetical protein